MQSSFGLDVAVAAEEDALCRLRTLSLQRIRLSAPANVEALGAWIYMMKLKGVLTAVVAAERTLPSRLVDEDLTVLASGAAHSLARTLSTPPSSVCAKHERRPPVLL